MTRTGTWISSIVHRRALLLRLTALILLVMSLGILGRADVQRVPTGTWMTIGDLGLVAPGAASTVLPDGRILLSGGTDPTGQPVAHVAIYDPATQAWTPVGRMATARTGHAATALPDGRVVIAGGATADGPSADIVVFNPFDQTSVAAGVMTTLRTGHAAATLADGRVLIAGGANADGLVQTAEIFDLAGTASAAIPMIAARAGLTATTLMDGRVLLAGGHDASGDLNTAEIYDPATNALTATPALLNLARSGHVALLLPDNNGVLIAGGTSFGAATASAEVYMPWNDTFIATTPMAQARSNALAGPAIEGTVLVGGGNVPPAPGLPDARIDLASAEGYGFATVKTDKTDYAPGETVTITGSGWEPNEIINWTLEEVFVPEGGVKDGPFAFTTQADATGNILDATWAPDWYDVGVKFHLTLRGTKSQAQAWFTDAVREYTATISPSSNTAGEPSSYTITITDKQDQQGLGSANITVPTGYSSVSLGTITVPTGKPWTATLASGVIQLRSNRNVNRLSPNESVSIALTATAPCPSTSPSSYTWMTAASQETTNFAANFDLIGPQPSVTLSGTCIEPTRLAVQPANGTYGGTTNLSATLTKTSDSSAVSGKTITFTLDGAGVGSATTNASGVAMLSNVDLAAINADTYPTGVGASFAGDSAYSPSNGSAALTVDKADSTVTVTCPTTAFTYTGSAQTPCTATVTGAGGLNLTPIATYTNNTNAGQATASYAYAGNDNHTASSDSKHFDITKAPVTVTGGSGSATFDGSAKSPAACVVAGAYTGDLTCTNNPASVGPGAGTTSIAPVVSGTGLDNFEITAVNGSFKIDPAASVTSVTCPGSVVYNGAAQTPCTATVTGAGGLNLTPTATYTNNTNAGQATASYAYAGDDNHTASSESKQFDIAKAPVTATAGSGSATFDGSAKSPAACVVAGAYTGDLTCTNNPASVGPGAGTTSIAPVVSGTGLDNFEVTPVNGSFKIDPAASVTSVTCPGSVVYNGAAQTPCTAVVTGAGGLSLTPDPVYANNTDAGTATASYTFAGDGNHQSSSGSKTFTIEKAASATVVTCTAGPFTYTGAAQTPCTAAVTGAGALNQSLTVNYSSNTNAGTATASASFAGDANHNGSNNSKNFTIEKATSTTTVTCTTDQIYTGSALTPCTAGVTGVGGLNQSLTVSYANNVNPGSATANASYAGDSNHLPSADSKAFTIGYGVCTSSLGPGGVILPPIKSDGTSVYNRKGGSTIPLKFRVCDASGKSISLPTAVFAGTSGSLTMLSEVRGTVTVANENAETAIPDAAFRWDSSGQQWIFNMATSNLSSGSTYAFRINLASGSIPFVVGVK